jgi:hypothetical protein
MSILLVETLFQTTQSRSPFCAVPLRRNNTCFLHLSPSSLATNESNRVLLASVIHPVMFNPGFEKCTLPAWRLRGDPFDVSNEAKNGHAAL